MDIKELSKILDIEEVKVVKKPKKKEELPPEKLSKRRKRIIKMIYLTRVKLEEKGVIPRRKDIQYPDLYKRIKKLYKQGKLK